MKKLTFAHVGSRFIVTSLLLVTSGYLMAQTTNEHSNHQSMVEDTAPKDNIKQNTQDMPASDEKMDHSQMDHSKMNYLLPILALVQMSTF